MSCLAENYCPDPSCGDRLIHQWNRGPHESSSAFGQFCHDEVTGATTISDVDVQLLHGEPSELIDAQVQQLHFVYGDIQRLRVFEHKPRGRQLSQGQKWIMPVWRRLVELGIRDQHISAASGVYLVESDPPFDSLAVTKFCEQSVERREFDRLEFLRWMGGAR